MAPEDHSGQSQYDIVIHDNIIHDTQCDGIIFATVDPSKGKIEVYNNIIYNAGKGPNNPEGSGNWTLNHVQYIVLPALTLAAMPAGIVMRSVRALVADTLTKDFVIGLVAKGMGRNAIFRHLAKNIAPTALAVFGVQLGYLMAGSILVETVFSWPGTGLLLNTAILQRDIPLLQGTIFVLAMFFVGLNLLVDMLQPFFDPRMKRA